MKELVKGQKQKLSELTSSQKLTVSIKLSWNQGSDLDFSCFGLDEAGKLSDDQYFVFYNQKKSPEGAISLSDLGQDQAKFEVDLEKLPIKIKRLTFTLAVDGASYVSGLGSSRLTVADGQGQEVLALPFSGGDFAQEKAVMLFEIYFKDVWRVGAICQGFERGLQALLEHFGGEASDGPQKKAPQESAPPPPKAEPAAPVSLKKITLEKRGESKTVDLSKKPGATTSFHINLNWDQAEKKGWFFKSKADLDLGCMLEMSNGAKTVIQALGGNMGSKTQPPWIYLDKDDRSGAAADGENLYILKPEHIRKVLVFAYIYEGKFKFTELNARITIKEPNGDEIVIKLDNPDSSNTFCAICLIKNVNNNIVVSKEEKYFTSHPQADQAYGFGFEWTRGSK
ncbi:MAG: TerD family protein [Deltaproteobacteria bacterium]|jgi:tellurite resistance protein TerA|nr:TerD family protein [Deltaproteobacteria bacterium]